MHSLSIENDQATRLRELAGNGGSHRTVHPTIISITSGKGGVGKSTLALNIALKLCDFGKRVLLFDADANLANIDVMLGITPEHRLGDVLRGEINLEDAFVSPYPRLKFLAGSSGEVNYPKINESIQEYTLRQLAEVRETPDFILVDTSAGLTQEVVNYSIFSDASIVVTNPEPTSIMDAYAIIKIISIAKPGHRFGIIINAAKSVSEADEAADKLKMVISHFLKTSVDYLGYIPYDLNVRNSIRHQVAVVQKYPRTRAAISMQQIAHKILFEKKSISERSKVTI